MDIVSVEMPVVGRLAIAVDPTADDPISTGLRTGRYPLPSSLEILRAGPGPGRGATVLDIGAHIGTFSLPAAALGYTVLAIEASAENARLLRASAEANGFSNVRVVQAAATDRAGTVKFFENGPYGLVNTPAFAPEASREVLAMPLDAILAERPIGRVDFIKMDIEGSELDALRGMKGLLARSDAPPIVYESNGHTLGLFGHRPQDLVAELAAHGYASYLAETGRLRSVDPGEPQYSCVVDNLACKRLLGDWPRWVSEPMGVAEQIARALAECNAGPAARRAYIARTLRAASGAVRRDSRIEQALDRLRSDADPEVARALAWMGRT